MAVPTDDANIATVLSRRTSQRNEVSRWNGKHSSDGPTSKAERFQVYLYREESCQPSYCCIGSLLLLLFFLALTIIGIALVESRFDEIGVTSRFMPNKMNMSLTNCEKEPVVCGVLRVVRAIGIFGLVGGITNWIAVEMLFCKRTARCGCGVILRQYKVIREYLRSIVLNEVFDTGTLQEYMSNSQSELTRVLSLEDRIKHMLRPEVVNRIIQHHLDELMCKREAVSASLVGVDMAQLRDFVQPHLLQLVEDLAPIITRSVCRSHGVDAVDMQQQIEGLVRSKMEELTAERIRQIVTVVIRRDLRWLVVYGCLAGGAVGLVAEVLAITIPPGTLALV